MSGGRKEKENFWHIFEATYSALLSMVQIFSAFTIVTHTLACGVNSAFLLTLPELKATSRAWLSFWASTSRTREMPSRRFLHQLLLSQQTVLTWRLHSQRCRRNIPYLHLYAQLLSPYIAHKQSWLLYLHGCVISSLLPFSTPSTKKPFQFHCHLPVSWSFNMTLETRQ